MSHQDVSDLPFLIVPPPGLPEETFFPPKNPLPSLSRWIKVIRLPLAIEADVKLVINAIPTFPFLFLIVVAGSLLVGNVEMDMGW